MSISSLVSALRTSICSPIRACRRSDVPQRDLGIPNLGRIDEHGHARRAGHQLSQQLEPFRRHFDGEKIDAGQVAAGPGEARD